MVGLKHKYMGVASVFGGAPVSKAMSLKAKIRNIAFEDIAPAALLIFGFKKGGGKIKLNLAIAVKGIMLYNIYEY